VVVVCVIVLLWIMAWFMKTLWETSKILVLTDLFHTLRMAVKDHRLKFHLWIRNCLMLLLIWIRLKTLIVLNMSNRIMIMLHLLAVTLWLRLVLLRKHPFSQLLQRHQ